VKKIFVEFEFDDNDLGPTWMNLDNLKSLLYSKQTTKPDLFKITKYKEEEETNTNS